MEARRHGEAARYEQGTGQGTGAVCATVLGKERAARARLGLGSGARPMGGMLRRVARIRLALGASLVGTGLSRPGCENRGEAGRY